MEGVTALGLMISKRQERSRDGNPHFTQVGGDFVIRSIPNRWDVTCVFSLIARVAVYSRKLTSAAFNVLNVPSPA